MPTFGSTKRSAVLEYPPAGRTSEFITLGHGGGGEPTRELIAEILVPAFENTYLNELHDGAVLHYDHARLAYSADSFVVHPPFFPGGDIGALAVHGTANNLAMCGARPMYLSLAFILEEGFPIDHLRRVVASVRDAARAVAMQVVTGDIKVVERGKGDGIYISTTGIGAVLPGVELSPRRVHAGDSILLSGPIAEHGIAVLSARDGSAAGLEARSDTAHLWPLASGLLQVGGSAVHALRDPTRGGVAAVVHGIVRAAGVGIGLTEAGIPVRPEVRGKCEELGLDPLQVANAGTLVAFVAPEAVETVLETMRRHPLGREACLVGEVTADRPGVVRTRTRSGGWRAMDPEADEGQPRVC